MNKFIRKSLEPGETIVYNGRLHWSYIFGYYFWTFVLFLLAVGACYLGYRDANHAYYYTALALVVLALFVYIIGRVVRTRSEFVVTATRFIQKDGIFNISMTEIPLFKVETVNYHQSLWQRMIGTGCIELVGSGGTSHQIHCIENPMDVRKTIVSAINKQGNKEETPVGQ
ncbi:MAG: PH domain-containing protein [Bacteroidaceae bacterium]|nr:PH domain-containing protein [Bacteroidaceae bacterium]